MTKLNEARQKRDDAKKEYMKCRTIQGCMRFLLLDSPNQETTEWMLDHMLQLQEDYNIKFGAFVKAATEVTFIKDETQKRRNKKLKGRKLSAAHRRKLSEAALKREAKKRAEKALEEKRTDV